MHTEKWAPSNELKARDIPPNAKLPMHPRCHDKGGMIMKDEGGTFKKAVKKLIGGFAESALKGEFSDIFKLSTPAEMHSPYSYIQTAANDVAMCGMQLRNAAREKDPLMRLKWLCGFYIGSLHRGQTLCNARVPFNPILGETV